MQAMHGVLDRGGAPVHFVFEVRVVDEVREASANEGKTPRTKKKRKRATYSSSTVPLP